MRTTYEGQPDQSEIDRHPIDVLGNYALATWQVWESGDLTDKQTVKAAKRLVGDLHSYALSSGIVPPEAAILDLTEAAEDAMRDLLEAGLAADADAKKHLHPDTVKRISRVLGYVTDQALSEIVVTSPVQTSPVMSLQEVVQAVSAADAVSDYTQALSLAHEHMGENQTS